MKKRFSLLLAVMMFFSHAQTIVNAQEENLGQEDGTQIAEQADESEKDNGKQPEGNDSIPDETESFAEAVTEELTEEKEITEDPKEPEEMNTAETETEENSIFNYEPEVSEKEEPQKAASSKCGQNVTWKYSKNTLTISGTGDMYNYEEDEAPPWIDYRDSIKTIQVNNGVTSVGDWAFAEYPNIERIVLPASIRKIGNAAFYNIFLDEDKNYAAITLPKNLEYVGGAAFYGNYCLPFSSSTFPSNVKYIGDYAFWNCNGLEGTIILPEGLEEIGDYAFSECYYTTGIKLPKTLKKIGSDCFSFLDEMTQVTIPNYIERIEDYTFYDCDLKNVVIGKNVKFIGEGAFMYNFNLRTVTFLGDAPEFEEYAYYDAFEQCSDVVVYYPSDNPTWTKEARDRVAEQFSSVKWAKKDFVGVDKVTINQSYSKIVGGKEYQFKAYVTPSNAYDTGIIWESGDPKMATVSLTGKVKGIKAGEATVIAKSAFDSTKTAEKKVYVLFSDVTDSSKYYYDAVYWALENGITTGTKPILFEPNTTCTRGHIVTFLWRLAGSPEPVTEPSFKDVKSDAWYAKAVAWAAENGITTGTTPTTFEPTAPCTRGHIVTFLWRYMGEPYSTAATGFKDVKDTAWYAKAVAWAYEKGVTTGKTDVQFDPSGPCTRGQGVLFLKRVDALPESRPEDNVNALFTALSKGDLKSAKSYGGEDICEELDEIDNSLADMRGLLDEYEADQKTRDKYENLIAIILKSKFEQYEIVQTQKITESKYIVKVKVTGVTDESLENLENAFDTDGYVESIQEELEQIYEEQGSEAFNRYLLNSLADYMTVTEEDYFASSERQQSEIECVVEKTGRKWIVTSWSRTD